MDMKKVEEKARATLPENGVPEEILRDLPFDSHLDKMLIQKQATTVHEPTANLKKVEDLMNVIVLINKIKAIKAHITKSINLLELGIIRT